MIRKFLSCLCFTACLVFSSYGQDSSQEHTNLFNFAFGGNFGVTKLSVKNLNYSLLQQNLPIALNKLPFYFEMNIFFDPITSKKKLIYYLALGYAIQRNDDGNIHLAASEIDNCYNVDYLLLRNDRQYFFPGIGIGWLNYKYNFINKLNYPSSYIYALQNFSGERTIWSGLLSYLNLEFNYSYALDKTNNCLLGIHTGFHVGLNSKTMQLSNGYILNESPKANSNGFIAAISLIIQ